MTTTVLNGFRFDYEGQGVPVAIAPSTMTVVTTEGFTARFRVVGFAPGEPLDVIIEPASGSLLQLRTSGSGITPATTVYLGTVEWGANKQTQLVVFNFWDGRDETDWEFSAVIGGDPLPRFTGIESFTNWLLTVRDIGPDTGALRPGVPFRLQDLDAFARSTEDDVLIGNPLFDDWSEVPLSTGRGNDSVVGTAQDEQFLLGSGNDTGRGGAGADRILGQDGNDLVMGGFQADTLLGGAGRDRIKGQAGDDILSGGADNDRLDGGFGNDRLIGLGGNDVLRGAQGRDRLTGGAGNDTLDGGTGDDRMSGGAGADEFVYATGGGRDRIADFADDEDVLRIAGRGDDSGTVLSFATDTATGVVFDFGNGDVLTVLGVTRAELRDDLIVL